MKLFFAVIAAAVVIGGFVGAEFMDSSFSITGAVIGGVGTAAVLLGLGAFFDAQEKKKEKELPPEMRAVFDRMLGQQSSSRSKQPTHSKKHSPRAKSGIDQDDPIGNTIKNLAKQQAEAAARGERVTNQLPKFVQINRLKLNIVQTLQDMGAESIGIDEGLYQKLQAIDTDGGLGIVAEEFDSISKNLPSVLLSVIETDIRATDSDKPRPSFEDIEQLYGA